MAAVEKRKPPWLALLINHLMMSTISLFIVFLNMDFGPIRMSFGIFFLILYLFGVYDYSNREGIEHTKSYSKIAHSFKYPIIYGFVGMSYLLVPALLVLILKFAPDIQFFVMIFLYLTNAHFFFEMFITFDYFNWYILMLHCSLIMAFSVLGYLSGIKGFRLAAVLSKYLYVRKKPEKK